MKQKKLLAFLLALVMTVSVLSACGASSNKGVAMDAMAPEAPMENMKYEVADDAIYSSASTVSFPLARLNTVHSPAFVPKAGAVTVAASCAIVAFRTVLTSCG